METTRRTEIRRIAIVGNFPPRLCGIATFTADVTAAFSSSFPDVAVDVYAMNDAAGTHSYPSEVVCEINQDDLADYATAAHRINESGADIVLVQHEYGIFGGAAGGLLLRLLDRVKVPVVATLHTVLEAPNAEQRTVMEALIRRSSKLIVMAQKGRAILKAVHGVPDDRIAVIPHGVPDRPHSDPDLMKPRFGFAGRKVLLTFGLLSPNKGIETMIAAMPAIAAAHPDVLYVVLGATHPHLVAQQGEAYRDGLQTLATELGVASHVRFIDGFLEQELLLDYLAAADIYVTPYLHEAQITSGTLSYAVGLGQPVVSTPYWHASELLADGVGVLCPFSDSDAFAREIIDLLGNDERRSAMRTRAWTIGRGMTWERLAQAYMAVCESAREHASVRLIREAAIAQDLVAPNLDAVQRMTDGVGMLQHAIFAVPDRDHGYCVDDNTRALILMHRIEGSDVRRADALAITYASFIQHAWNGKVGRFRNFMGYDRQWLEQAGSEDSFGRTLWSLGVTAAEARRQDLRRWAMHLFDQVAPYARALISPRTWAFAILGADAVLDAHPGHGLAMTLLEDCGARLHDAVRGERRDEWTWFESTLAYDNSRLPEALIRAAHRTGRREWMDAGLETLAWLDEVQTSERGHFRAVGTASFGRPHQPPLPFDQQPLEAWATVDAMAAAYAVTGDPRWMESAWRAYRWYLGSNDLGLPIGQGVDGSCFDGLMSDRVNLNQGAESVLSFQLACCTMARFARVNGSTRERPVAAATS